MEKLIELLNQHRIEKTDIQYELELPMPMRDWRFILSREYWFIQWLVENEKIDFDSDIEFYFLQREQHTKTESLLMLLSIQDNPIEFLVSILK